jgi:hypothetical protein
VHPIQFGTKTFVKKDPQLPALRSLSIDKAGELALEIEGVGYRPVGWSGRAPARSVQS